MGVNQGDFIRIVDKQTYLGVDVLNVYHYRYVPVAPSTNDIYASLADWFEDNIIDEVRKIQVADLNHFGVTITNLTNQLDIYERSIDIDGNLSSASEVEMPSYVTAGFILRRESLTTRNGYKRFSGLSDEYVNGNQFGFPSGAKTAIETALAEDVVLGVLTAFEPVILRDAEDPEDPPTIYASIGSAQFTRLGTQNTRKS